MRLRIALAGLAVILVFPFATSAQTTVETGTAANYRGQNNAVFSRQCPPSENYGAVWGTGTYTDDSSICGAAVHAGIITKAGGYVAFTIKPGKGSYKGSTKNGITSQSWKKWPGSFVFEQKNTTSASFGKMKDSYTWGEKISWIVEYKNVPSDGNVCLIIVSDTGTWEGGFQGFGGSDGCYWATGNGYQEFAATLNNAQGFDFAPGRYHLVATLIKTYPVSGPTVVYASAKSASFTVQSEPTISSQPAPKITFRSNLTTVRGGQSATLSWNVTGAQRCVLTYGSTQLTDLPVKGTQVVRVAKSTKYTLWCADDNGQGKDGASAEKSLTISALGVSPETPTPSSPKAPSCTITANKSSYVLGDVATFSWTSKNATYGVWVPDTSGKDNIVMSGDKLSTSGKQSVTINVLGNPFVTMEVFNASGEKATCSKTISVAEAPAFSIKLSASPSFAYTGQSIKVSWTYTGTQAPTATDWIVVVPQGTKLAPENYEKHKWFYTGAALSGSKNISLPSAGTYDIVYLSKDGYTELARKSAAISVEDYYDVTPLGLAPGSQINLTATVLSGYEAALKGIIALLQ